MTKSYLLSAGNLKNRMLILLMTTVAATLAVFPALAATPEQNMAWGEMGMKLFGGLALFLFGMEQMSESLKAVAGCD